MRGSLGPRTHPLSIWEVHITLSFVNTALQRSVTRAMRVPPRYGRTTSGRPSSISTASTNRFGPPRGRACAAPPHTRLTVGNGRMMRLYTARAGGCCTMTRVYAVSSAEGAATADASDRAIGRRSAADSASVVGSASAVAASGRGREFDEDRN